MEIDFSKLIKGNIKIFSGRDKGENARKNFNLDKLDLKEDEIVNVFIPEEIWSINSSFFLGCFGPSVRKLGEDGFREKYVFNCGSIILKNIEDGISRALKTSNPLKR